MEREKRKRVSDGEPPAGGGRRAKLEEDGSGSGGGAVNTAAPADDEVEEFFAILRRMQVALRYFRKRDGGRELTAAPAWIPSFEREDFDGVKRSPLPERPNPGLDLNSDPAISE